MSGRTPVRVGVVGLGQWGRHHARVFASLPGVDLVGVVDRDVREARAGALRHGTVGHTDHRALLGRVDAVSVVVPTGLHYAITRDFLEGGVHVLVEKPMTATVEEARRLVDLAARRNAVMLVGHVERFKPAVQRLPALAREPLLIQARRVRPYDPHRIMDVGVVLDLMIHDIDIVLALAPGRVVDVAGVGVCVHNSQEDLAVAHLVTDSGCRVTLTASRVSAVKAVEMEITTAERAIHLDFLRETISVRHFSGEQQRLALDGEEPLRAELAHFVACVRGEERPLVTGEDGLRALEVSHRLLQSMVGITPRVPA
ncbi:MAG: Gfo/Idh/MocA family oxidoreductase [Armatimonadota bacterium]|nr:Gfo/Idh/MocA family oxidoreductase [Armatimonadota bacterium]MDR7532723.1 Gfo/Idh/MocA family oxidoreductase [Armatimonadota bacterium]MDR7535343.1 Gfo/Idh/MocA family oxidoreductase [Armatimonadota bacterium]